MKDFDEQVTIGDKYGPAMAITDQAEADAYFDACVRHCMKFGRSRAEAEKIEKSNFGYYAGYCSDETMRRVNRLFRTTHPIFGDVSPNPEAALEAGRRMAKGA